MSISARERRNLGIETFSVELFHDFVVHKINKLFFAFVTEKWKYNIVN